MRLTLPSVLAVAIGAVSPLLWLQDRVTPELQVSNVGRKVVVANIEMPLEASPTAEFPSISGEILIEVASRPLFSPSRRPEQYIELTPETEFEPSIDQDLYVEETAPQLETEPIPMPTLAMSGFMASDQGPTALIRNDDGQSERWMSIGTAIEGWLVVSITPQETIFTRENSKLVVKLYE